MVRDVFIRMCHSCILYVYHSCHGGGDGKGGMGFGDKGGMGN